MALRTGKADRLFRIDDFEVSIFLPELSTRHSLLVKQKQFDDKRGRIRGNSGKLTGWLTSGTSEKPIAVADDALEDEPVVIRQEADDEPIDLDNIPEVIADVSSDPQPRFARGSKRQRGYSGSFSDDARSNSDDEAFQTQRSPPSRRRKRPKDRGEKTVSKAGSDNDEGATEDDKKKLALRTSYEGFSIYGRILFLIISKKGGRSGGAGSRGTTKEQQMLENWMSSQAAQGQGDEGDEEG